MQKTIRRENNLHIPVLLIVSAVVLSIRARYGYFFNDEPFILSLAQRLAHGASLIADEWNTTQNIGTLLLPLYRLYTAINGSTDGILLTFRTLYCVMWACTCTAVYCVIRKRFSGGLLVFFYLIFFSPLEQMTLSYTSISLSCVLLLTGLFFYHFSVKPIPLFVFTAVYTVLFIIAVVALPYLALVYALIAAAGIVAFLVKRNNTTRFLFRMILLSGVAVMVIAAIYLWCFVLRDHSLESVLQNLGYILSSDYGASTSFIFIILRYILHLQMYYSYLFMIALSLILLHTPVIRNHPGRKYSLFFLNCLAFLMVYVKTIALVLSRQSGFVFNLQMLPIVFLGLLAFFMLDDRKPYWNLFLFYCVPGVLFSVAFYFASDTGPSAIAMGLSVCGVASIVFIAELGKQCRQFYCDNRTAAPVSGSSRVMQGRILASVFALVFCVQLSAQGVVKYECQYWDTAPRKMTAAISDGPGQGLRTTPERVADYAELSEGLNELLKHVDRQQAADIRFFSMVFSPALYLDADLPVGCFSTWTFMEDDELLQRLDLYYSVNPAYRPNVIFCARDDARIQALNLDLSDYQTFSHGSYSILIAPEYVHEGVF